VQDKWRGIPTRLNNIPHSREIREYFYNDVLEATQRAVDDGKKRLKVTYFSAVIGRLGGGKFLII